MGFTLINHAAAGCISGDAVAGPTSAIDTTGADSIVIAIAIFGNFGGTFDIPTDNKGNVYTRIPTIGGSSRLFYCVGPTVGTGHTFTWNNNGAGNFPSIYISAWSGMLQTSPVDQTNGNLTSATPGSITPSQANCLVITGFRNNGSSGTTPTVSTGFTVTDAIAFLASGDNEGGGMAYQIQTTTATANPTWSPASTPSSVIASFFGAATNVTTTQTITGKGRIQVTTTQTLSGKARMQITSTQTISGKAHMTGITPQTITGKANLKATTVQTVTGKGRVQKTTTQTIPGKGRIALISTQTLTGKANMVGVTNQLLAGKGRIALLTNRTITGVANLSEMTSQTLSGIARMAVTTLQTITGKARIFIASKTDADRTFHVLADGRVYVQWSESNVFYALTDERYYKVLE